MVQVQEVFLIALLAGSATGLGALPIFFTEQISHKVYDSSLGFAAGIMFGAAVFTLILPGMEFGNMWEVMAGILVGGVFLLVTNRLIPHLHAEFEGEKVEGLVHNGDVDSMRKAILIAAAITIHNIPEGLAVGIAFGSGLESVGLILAVVIGIQNVPDGFAMAVPASKTDIPKAKTLLYTTLSGGVPEPLAAILGFVLVSLFTELFAVAAGVAAGAMIAVIFREMIPSSHGHGYADFSTLTFVTGFVFMMFIDNTFTV